ncbi:CRTAC1 family protein [Peredibacter sp. HCB2-198]|uniref:CRTAC1 family protein n=1 Tax=Peredibacter sp. HCB2-198 TaxID=3383025 RepID=UPI0038B66D28
MKKLILVPTLVSVLTSCSTQTPVRDVASINSEGKVFFEDVTHEANVAEESTSSIIIGDYNKDGKVDFIARDRLYKNISTRDHIRFQDVTQEMNLHFLKGYPLFMDVNNDGELDIVTSKGQVHLLKDKQYVEVGEQYGLKLPSDVFAISFGDLNRDGWPDLLVGRHEKQENNQFKFVSPKVFINQNGRAFKEVSSEHEMNKFPAYVRGIAWADYNNNRSPDIYYSNYRLAPNFLFQIEKGKMVDVAKKLNVQGEYDTKRYYDEYYKKKFGPLYGHTIGSVWADLNNDGNLDLWVSNLVHKFVGKTPKGSYDYRGYVCDDSKIYKNTGAPYYKLVDVRKNSGLPIMPIGDYSKYKGDELWSHSTAADFDNDGLLDMYVSQVYNLKYAYSLLFRNTGNFKFENVSKEGPMVLDSYAGAWADFNNDGKMDLIVSGREDVDVPARIRVFKNVESSGNRYLKIRLIGKKSGTIPVTTQVRVLHAKGMFMRQVEGTTGTFNQQNDPVLHFGLGRVSKLDSIVINWSSGHTQIIDAPKVNTTITITEP